jgi:ribose-phosphate pyrophosphokinase
MSNESMTIFTGNANPVLAKSVADYLGQELGKAMVGRFSDGEIQVEIQENVRSKHVVVLQPTCAPTNDNLMELMIMVDALKRASAGTITAVIPYFGYARQDRRPRSARVAISARLVANMLQSVAGVGRVLTMDLHADQIQGFFNIPVTHIEGKNVFDDYIYFLSSNGMSNIILCGPDAGSGKRVKRMKDQLAKKYNINLNYVMLDKTRKEANIIDEMVIIGDVIGKDVIILDDMVDTAGTLCKAAEVLIENGAKSVRAIISHGVLSGPAYNRIDDSMLTELIISDSLESMVMDKIIVFSVAEQIGMAIAANNLGLSYDALKTSKKLEL